jgi:DNA-binding PadR family transcriptional regulator
MYPQSVNEFVAQVVDSLEESGFLKEEKVDRESAIEAFGEIIFDKWKRGDELIMTEEEAIKGMQMSVVISSMKELTRKNLVDTIEDENGEPIYFLTKQGRDYAENKLPNQQQ